MKPRSPLDSDGTNAMLGEVARGCTDAFGRYLAEHRDRLRRMIALRLDPRLQGRVDPSDVVQECQFESARRIQEFLDQPNMPFFVWVRLIAAQCLAQAHRTHLGTKRRDAARDFSLDQCRLPPASSQHLAAQLLGRLTPPSQAAMRREWKARLQAALESMSLTDREVLVLRHFEHLTTSETAHELGIGIEATKKRYLRALRRLKTILAGPHDEQPASSP
jgi:RNA polymerase sigma-70 factor (ECF subfamily)